MKRIKIHFESIQQIVGGEGLSVVLMADEDKERVLSVVCDEPITQQIAMRLRTPRACRTFLPETLLEMLMDTTPSDYEMMIFGIHDGQYQVVLSATDYQHSIRLRMSDAVLLSILTDRIPLYIEEKLMEQQSVPYDRNATGIAIPINTMDRQRLGEALQRAIEVENYELASHLRDEINRRQHQHSSSK